MLCTCFIQMITMIYHILLKIEALMTIVSNLVVTHAILSAKCVIKQSVLIRSYVMI